MSNFAVPSTKGLPSFSRALSPALAGVAVADAAGAPSEQRNAALALAGTLDEIVLAIPRDYREVLRPLFRELAQWTAKSLDVGNSLEKLRTHKANRTLPAELAGMKVPTLQLSAAFIDGEHPPHLGQITEALTAFKAGALDVMIEAREKELAFYEAKIKPDSYGQRFASAVRVHYETRIKPNTKVATFVDRVDANGVTNVLMGDLVDSKPHYLLAERTWSSSLAYGAAIVSMEMSKGAAAKARASAKKAIKDSADVEMGNTTSDDTSDISELKKSVASLSKQLASLSTKGNTASGKQPAKTQPNNGKKTSLPPPKGKGGKPGPSDKAKDAAKKHAKTSGGDPKKASGNRRK